MQLAKSTELGRRSRNKSNAGSGQRPAQYTAIGSPAEPRRRGFAMMLVLIGLAVVTVSVSVYLGQVERAPDMSSNVVNAVQARAAAETGLALTNKILNADGVDWKTAHVDGVLIDEYDFGGGTISVTIADAEGNVPTADTETIVITSKGSVGSLAQITEAEINTVETPIGIDYDLSEFAVFANWEIEVDDAFIYPWRLADFSNGVMPTRLGTNSKALSSLSLSNSAYVYDGLLYTREKANTSAILDTRGSGREVVHKPISEDSNIPLPTPPTPDTSGCTPGSPYTAAFNSGTRNLSVSREFGNFALNNTANVVIPNDGTVVHVLGSLILNAGDIFVRGDTKLVIGGNLVVGAFSTIEVLDGATLEIYVGGNIEITEGAIGFDELVVWDADRDPKDSVVEYRNPSDIKIYNLNGNSGGQWLIRNRSFVCAQLYGPVNTVDIESQSALFGNVVCDEFRIESGSYLHYDPALDERMGYTNANSMCYATDGSFDESIASLATTLEDSTKAAVENHAKNNGDLADKRKKLERMYIRMRHYGFRAKDRYAKANSNEVEVEVAEVEVK